VIADGAQRASNREVGRSLERQLARRIFRPLQAAETLDNRAMTIHGSVPRGSFGLT
jgi:hypothetical protein